MQRIFRLYFATVTIVALTVCGIFLTAARRRVQASAPSVPSNTWAQTGDLTTARAGAASVLLYGGQILVTGGVTGDGSAVASVERYSPDGGDFLATPAMAFARADHTATLLPDGRVLVAGGIGADGRATSSAEVYDPSTNSWTTVGALHYPRSGHTATALYDGRVVITGGTDGSTPLESIEVFDPSTDVFMLSNAMLDAARSGHAAALLYDGSVLVAGGFDGANPLASTDVYDPWEDTVTAGPSLLEAQAGLSATTLLDGKVLLAGGAGASGELSTAEVYDPAAGTVTPTANSMIAARQNHQAILLPNNSQVLIVGGTAGPDGNAVTTAEVYAEWQGDGGTFYETSAPATARAWSTATALSFLPGLTIRGGPTDGLVLLTGGSPKADASGALKTSELYGFATVETDRADYAPGTTVNISGSGWQPGETVTLTLVEDPPNDTHVLQPVVADGLGHIFSSEFAPDAGDLGIRFYLTATGAVSQAQTSFTDDTADSMAVSPTSVQAGATGQTFTFSFTSGTDHSAKNDGVVTVAVPSTWTNPTGNVSVSAGTCGASLGGITGGGPWTITINDECGKDAKNNAFSFTYNNVTAPSAGTYTFTTQSGTSGKLSDVGGSQPQVTTATGALDHFNISTISSPQTAGTAITGITITAKDSANNTVTSFTSTVTYGGTAGITGTSGSFSAGVLSGVSVTPTVAGTSRTFAVTGSGKTGTATFDVNAGALDHFAISAISSPQTAGTAITGVTLTAQDVNNNTVTSFTSTVAYSGTAGITGTSAAFTAGQLTGVSVTPTSAGSSRTFIVTASAKTGTATFTVNPGPMNHFTLTLATPQTNGVAFTGTNTLTAQDVYGNTVTSFNASANNVTIAPNSPLTGSVSGLSGGNKLTGAGDFASGVATLTSALKYTGDGNIGTFTATAATGGYTGTSGSVAFSLATEYATGSFTWDNGTTAKWSSVSGGSPVGTYNSIWNAGNNGVLEGTAGTVSVAASGATAASLTFNTTGYTVQSNTLTLQGAATVTNGTGIASTINSAITGSAGLNAAGAGTLTLGGTNTYSGATAIDTGTLKIGAANGLGSSTSIAFANGGTLYATSSMTLSQAYADVGATGGDNFQVDSPNTLILTGTASEAGGLHTYGSGTVELRNSVGSTGQVVINSPSALRLGTGAGTFSATNFLVSNGGTFDLASKDLSMGASATLDVRGAGVGSNGALINSTSSTTSTIPSGIGVTLTANPQIGGAGNITIAGVMSGAASRVTKIGGGTVTLQGVNTYAGEVHISAGTLALDAGGSIGAPRSSTSAAERPSTCRRPRLALRSGPARPSRPAAAPRPARWPQHRVTI